MSYEFSAVMIDLLLFNYEECEETKDLIPTDSYSRFEFDDLFENISGERCELEIINGKAYCDDIWFPSNLWDLLDGWKDPEAAGKAPMTSDGSISKTKDLLIVFEDMLFVGSYVLDDPDLPGYFIDSETGLRINCDYWSDSIC